MPSKPFLMGKAQDCFPFTPIEVQRKLDQIKIAGTGVEVVWRCCWVLEAGRGGEGGRGKQVAGVWGWGGE